MLGFISGCDDVKPVEKSKKIKAPAEKVYPNAPAFIIVEQKEPSFTVFIALSKDTKPEQLAEIKEKVSAAKDTVLLPWDTFLQQINSYISHVMKVDDYPNINITDGLVCLLGSNGAPGAPWGLTWNGGIALTYRDYESVRKSYAKYLKDPASHEANTKPNTDSIFPNHHLTFAGCKQ